MSSKPRLNILKVDIEDAAEHIKLKLLGSKSRLQVGVDLVGDLLLAWPGHKDIPSEWLVGTYTRAAKVDDIESDLVERLRELRSSRAKSAALAAAFPALKAAKRQNAPETKVVRNRSESTLGCIPAPSARIKPAQSEAGASRESVADFEARGGRVERLKGFESVCPHSVLPAWKAAA